MSDNEEASRHDSAISTPRLESFSDGVFAIAATLLILDVHAGTRSLGSSLLHSWPSYAAYAVSFVAIGIIWINHHTVFAQIGQVDRLFLRINVLFLMFVAFIPFPTGLIAAHLRGCDLEPAALTYGPRSPSWPCSSMRSGSAHHSAIGSSGAMPFPAS